MLRDQPSAASRAETLAGTSVTDTKKTHPSQSGTLGTSLTAERVIQFETKKHYKARGEEEEEEASAYTKTVMHCVHRHLYFSSISDIM